MMIISNSGVITSFKAYKGVNWYGSDSDRKKAGAIPNIEPIDLVKEMIKSYTADIAVGKALGLTAQKSLPQINGAMGAFVNITKNFLDVAEERAGELVRKNPSGSNVPLVGVFLMFANEKKFGDELINETVDVVKDWVGIKKRYISGKEINGKKSGIIPMVKTLTENLNIISELSNGGIKKTREGVAKVLTPMRKNVSTSLTEFDEKFLSPVHSFMTEEYAQNIWEKQHKRQNARIVRKSLLGMLHVVPFGSLLAIKGDAAMDILQDGLADMAHDSASDLMLDFFSNSIGEQVSSTAIDSANVTAEHLSDFIADNPRASLFNVGEFSNSFNLENLKHFGTHAAFVAGINGVSNTLEENIKNSRMTDPATLSLKGLTGNFLAQSLIAPLTAMGAMGVEGSLQGVDIKGMAASEHLSKLAHRVINEIPGEITHSKLKAFVSKAIEKAPDGSIDLLGGKLTTLTSKITKGNIVKESEFKEIFDNAEELIGKIPPPSFWESSLKKFFKGLR